MGDSKPKKVIFAGIDRAGKSSIIHFLNRQYHLISEVKPTKGREITVNKESLLGLNFNIWDFGGQLRYRKESINNADMYFREVSAMFFVIDVQDERRYDESIEYLLALGQEIPKLNPDLKGITILLHKYDPDLRSDSRLKDNLEIIQDKIISLPIDLDLFFYESSIYDGTNILAAFSEAMIIPTEHSKNLQEILEAFISDHLCSAATIINEKGIFLTNTCTDFKHNVIIPAIIPKISMLIDSLDNLDVLTKNIRINTEFLERDGSKIENGSLFVQYLDFDSIEKVFLIALAKDDEAHQKVCELVPDLKEKIKSVLKVKKV